MIYSSKKELDKFYTNPSVARFCINQIDLSTFDKIIEPSAGNGSFLNQLNHHNVIGLDLLPESENIQQQDFFDYEIHGENVLVIGNPPFGKRNLLSLKFIQHAASFQNVKTIAFVLPNVFNKHTLQKQIPNRFKLKAILSLPDNSFLIDEKPYHVPCSFFIFEDSNCIDLRFNPSLYKESKHFIFTNKENGDFFVLGASPKTVKNISDVDDTNRGYYLKVKDGFDIHFVKENFKKTLWSGYSSANGGVFWLTKAELVKIYDENN